MTEQYMNNPLHGLGLEALITELVEFYGFEILAEALNFNCFRLNPSIKGSYKFLKKTEWARQKIELFYLYKFKNLPRPDAKQYDLPPRDRIVPEHQKPREPITFTLEELKKINEQKAERAKNHKPTSDNRRGKAGSAPRRSSESNAWSNARSDSRSESKPPRSEKPVYQKPAAKSTESNGEAFDPWGQARKNLANKSQKDDD